MPPEMRKRPAGKAERSLDLRLNLPKYYLAPAHGARPAWRRKHFQQGVRL